MFRHYALGFVFSVLLTLLAYFIVANHLLIGGVLIFTILALAVIQLWVQLILFLHIGQEGSMHWKLVSWLSTMAIILIVILGTLWIMDNLSYHMPTNEEIMHEENIYR